MEIVFLIISNSNYFMEFQNPKKSHEFVILKNFKVHNTEFTDVCAHLVTKKGNFTWVCNAKAISRTRIINDSRAFFFQLKRGQPS